MRSGLLVVWRFQPALYMGSDGGDRASGARERNFNPHPMRGVTFTGVVPSLAVTFQPALPMRGVTMPRGTPAMRALIFNLHSPAWE